MCIQITVPQDVENKAIREFFNYTLFMIFRDSSLKMRMLSSYDGKMKSDQRLLTYLKDANI